METWFWKWVSYMSEKYILIYVSSKGSNHKIQSQVHILHPKACSNT